MERLRPESESFEPLKIIRLLHHVNQTPGAWSPAWNSEWRPTPDCFASTVKGSLN